MRRRSLRLSTLLCSALLLSAATTCGAQAAAGRPPTLDDEGAHAAKKAKKAKSAATPTPAASKAEAAGLVLDPTQVAKLLPDPSNRAAYRIGPGDGISIEILRHPEFKADGRVSDRGTLVMPILGDVPVAGLTVSELHDKLAKIIGDDYLVDPQVLVNITAFENMKVFITGSVANPGLQRLSGPVTLLELLSIAGSFAGDHANTVIIERPVSREVDDGDTKVQVRDTETVSVDLRKLLREGDTSQNVELHNGDKIYVPPDDSRVYVFGEVASPGFFPYHEGLTLYEAINLAGGLDEFASDKKIKIRRRVAEGKDEPQEIRVNLRNMLKKGDITANAPLQDGDVIIVGSSFLF